MSTATLELRADSRQVRTATSDLERLNGVGDTSTRMVTTLRRGFIALGGAAALGKAISSTASFSQAVANLSAITGAAGEQLDFYRRNAAEIGRTTTLSASQAVEAYQLIASASPQLLENSEALDRVTRSAVTLAEATGQDLPTAARALGSAMNQFQLDASRADEVINVLAVSSQLGSAAVAQVSEALRNAGPAAQALGIDLTETVAGIQALAAAGREGSDAGTALRQVMLRLERTGDSALQPSVVGLNKALAELESRNLSNTELMGLFGDEAFSAATAILGQRDVLERLNGTLRGTNTAYDQAGTRVDTLTGDIKALGSAIEGLTIAAFGSDIEDLNRSLVQAATQGVNSLTENFDRLTDAATVLAVVYGGRLVQGIGAATTAKIATVVANARILESELALARSAQQRAVQEQAAAARSLALARNDTLRAGAIARLASANQTLIASNQKVVSSQAAVTAATSASAVGARALTAAYAAIGGPVGVAALAAFGVYRLSQSYRDGLQAQEDRTTKIMEEYKAQQALNEELRKAGRLFEDTAQATAAGATAMDNYQRSVDAAYAAQLQGMSQSQIQEEFDNVSASLQRAESRLARVSERFGEGTLRYKQAEETVRALRAQLAALNGVFPNLTTSSEQLSESIQKVRQSLEDQIYELEEGERAYELLIATRQAGIALDSEEAAGLAELIDKRNKLTEAQREQARVAREQAAAQRDEQRTGQEFEQLTGALSIETADDPQAAALEAQLEERLRLIDEYRMTKEADQEAADQAELAAFESLEMQKTRIAEQEAQTRRQAQISQLDSTASFFGDVAQLAQNAGKEQFEAYKAAATAQAVIGTYSSAVKAYDALAGIPYVGPALGIAAAATAVAFGLQQVSAIRSQQYAPRAAGGQVLDGRQYLVGERGPELITMRGNGQVTPNSQFTQGAQSNVNQQANITFEIPQTDDNIRRVLADSQDIIFNAVNQALRRQGRTL